MNVLHKILFEQGRDAATTSSSLPLQYHGRDRQAWSYGRLVGLAEAGQGTDDEAVWIAHYQGLFG